LSLGLRVPLFVGFCLFASVCGADVSRPQDTMAQRMSACTPCHGKEGRPTSEGYYPRIAGKPAGYLFNQLRHFRDGSRQNQTMTYLVEHMTDEYMREIAQYFSDLDLPYPPPEAHDVSEQILKRGEQLVREGDKSKDIPACESCHGERLTGVKPSIPGLAGLPKGYVASQIGAWKSGLRRATEPDCISQSSRRLSMEDFGAVSTWLSMRPMTGDTKPAASLPSKPPLECGSGIK